MFIPPVPFPVIGLTGGIASGKSTVGRMLAEQGWTVLDADQASRDVVAQGSEGLATLVEAFGKNILTPEGALDRRRLGAMVFQDEGQRRRLEALLHPRIEALLVARLQALPPETRGAALDASLWIEQSHGHAFDALWLVEAPEALRIQRVMARDGLDEAQASARLRAQSRDGEKRLHAHHRILADGRDLRPQIQEAERATMTEWISRRAGIWSPPMETPFTPAELSTILETLLSRGGDEAEVFMEHRRACGLGMDDGRMEDVISSEVFGVSMRLVEGDATRFADLIAPGFEELLEAARTLAAPGQGAGVSLDPPTLVTHPSPSPVQVVPDTVPLLDKVALVKRTEALARSHGDALRPGALRQVAVGYGDSTQHVWIACALQEAGRWRTTLTQDRRIQSLIRLNVTAGEGEHLQTGYRALGETRGFELFSDDAVSHTVKEAVRLAIQALDAKPAPSGTFPVILSSSAGGTMIHEACGHGLEADLALAGVSAFANKLGQKVAADGVTIIDDGTLPHKRGSAAIDDEGHPTTRVVLIEHGILKAYLQSRKTARRMGVDPTGNGRRDGYRNLPIPRMRNTFLAPGDESPEAILKDLDRGLLVKHMGGGQVDTTTGNFVFQVTEGYWVEGGQVRHPVKNATLAGCGPEVLQQLTRIGNDLQEFDIGTCGKDGQGVPVSDALPTILCPALVVGGTGDSTPTED